jgi:glycosyltransferase involved in cell wall biosynthesis
MNEAGVNPKLAIIIPAYKSDFLAKALACLVRQTDQRFNIYVCDDASPADISGVARLTLGARAYVYKRFENNLGGGSLARHWNRCVALGNEPWVWMFSDDDLMDDGCVAAFYKFLETEGEDADMLRTHSIGIEKPGWSLPTVF